ncbi:MAG: hypothetical protein QG594_2334, partial [Bacteroidota bacterium]|nr:hypothetical protein [Bacteroidota bacterium]
MVINVQLISFDFINKEQ